MYRFSNEMLELFSDSQYIVNTYSSDYNDFDESTFSISVESDWNSYDGGDYE